MWTNYANTYYTSHVFMFLGFKHYNYFEHTTWWGFAFCSCIWKTNKYIFLFAAMRGVFTLSFMVMLYCMVFKNKNFLCNFLLSFRNKWNAIRVPGLTKLFFTCSMETPPFILGGLWMRILRIVKYVILALACYHIVDKCGQWDVLVCADVHFVIVLNVS